MEIPWQRSLQNLHRIPWNLWVRGRKYTEPSQLFASTGMGQPRSRWTKTMGSKQDSHRSARARVRSFLTFNLQGSAACLHGCLGPLGFFSLDIPILYPYAVGFVNHRTQKEISC